MYYLDTDLEKNCFYIAPYKIPEDGPYLIRFYERWKADDFKRKLISGLVKDPLLAQDSYIHVETFKDPSLGEVKIYEHRNS